MDAKLYKIVYQFRLANQERKVFSILIDPKTISLIQHGVVSIPEWAKLEYHQCECCPFEKTEHPYCPIAVNINNIVIEFRGMVPTDNCQVICITPERTYMKKTSIMEGLASIYGVVMATSNCPVMDFFKPMARFHLPFSTSEETAVRATSMFLLRRYFEYGSDTPHRFDFKQLEQIYTNVIAVNKGLYTRIKSLETGTVEKIAVIILNSFSLSLSLGFKYSLESLAYLFTPQDKAKSNQT